MELFRNRPEDNKIQDKILTAKIWVLLAIYMINIPLLMSSSDPPTSIVEYKPYFVALIAYSTMITIVPALIIFTEIVKRLVHKQKKKATIILTMACFLLVWAFMFTTEPKICDLKSCLNGKFSTVDGEVTSLPITYESTRQGDVEHYWFTVKGVSFDEQDENRFFIEGGVKLKDHLKITYLPVSMSIVTIYLNGKQAENR